MGRLDGRPGVSRSNRVLLAGIPFVVLLFAAGCLVDRGSHANGDSAEQTTLAAPQALRLGFSPGSERGSAQQLVIDEIGKAHKQLLIAAYEFTSAPIAAAVVAAKQRGVDVQVVLDRTQARPGGYSAARFLAHAGVNVRIDYVPAIMHNKFLCIDGTTVQTGSFNYTKSAASRNAENAIAIDDPQLALQYATEFLRLSRESQPYAE